jgi:hypothetical protein
VTTTVNIAKIAKDLGVGLTTTGKYPPFTYTFDPFDEAETKRVKSQLLARQNIELQISPSPSGARSEIGRDINRKLPYHAMAENPPGGGVFYHPPTTVEMLLIDHNYQKAQAKANKVAAQVSAAIDAAQEAMAEHAAALALAKPSATPTPTPTPPTKPTPTPPPKDNTVPPPAPDKTQPSPKPATLCHVVVTVPDVDQVACLPLGRSFLTKRESNLGFAHGMPTTFVFKQPSGVQALTGTLSSITGIVASAVPTLINVKSTPSAPAKSVETPAPVAAVQNKSTESRSGGKATPAQAAGAALSVEETSPANAQDYKDEIDRLSRDHAADTDTINKMRLLFIIQLKAEGNTNDQINAILIKNNMWPLTASELQTLEHQ